MKAGGGSGAGARTLLGTAAAAAAGGARGTALAAAPVGAWRGEGGSLRAVTSGTALPAVSGAGGGRHGEPRAGE